MTILQQALRDVDAWVAYLAKAEVPVMAATAQALEALRDQAEELAPAQLADVIDTDPLMSIKFLAWVGSRRRHADDAEPETVLASVVLMGVQPFFAAFGPQPTVEERLVAEPEALEAVQELHRRSERAARFALAFAVHRADPEAPLISQTAYLQDFAEMLLWCHAPALMRGIRHAQRADPQLRGVTVQRQVLNTDLATLRERLLAAWRIPDSHWSSVSLACRLARHTMRGWDNAAIPDDISEIAQLVNATPRVALAYVRKVDAEA